MNNSPTIALLLTAALAAGCTSTGSQRLSTLEQQRTAPNPQAAETDPAPGPQLAHTEPTAATETLPQIHGQVQSHEPEQTSAQVHTDEQPPLDALVNDVVDLIDLEPEPEPIETIAASPARTPEPEPAEVAQPTAATPSPNIQRTLVREQALEILERTAFSEHALLRANAIEALHPAPSRLAPLVREALADANPGVRYVAAMSVGKLRLSEFASESMHLAQDADPRVRAAALFAQTRNGFKPDLTPIADLLFSDDPSVRSQAAFILGELANESALPMLRAVAAKHSTGTLVQDRIFRLQLAEAMVKLGDTSAAQTIHVALYPALRDEFEAAVLAAQILGEINDRQSIQQLVNVVEARLPQPQQNQPGARPHKTEQPYLYPPELRIAAATSLAKMGYPDGVYVADEYAAHSDHLVRAQTTFLYADAHRQGDLPRLVALMSDPSPVVQTAAASSALRYLDPDAR